MPSLSDLRLVNTLKTGFCRLKLLRLQQAVVIVVLVAAVFAILLSFPIRHLYKQVDSIPLVLGIFRPDETVLRNSLPGFVLSYYKNFIQVDKNIPRLSLKIKFKHYQKIARKREQALKIGALFSSSDDFVPANIGYQGRSLKAKIRLKGDHTDHIKGHKWSFKVKMRGKNRLFGMRNFSMQAPYTRGYQSEAIYLDILRRFGILAPRAMFVDLTVNGEPVGVMQVEEGFSKELLESQQRREGPLLKLNEADMWLALRLQSEQKKLPQLWLEFFNWRITNLLAFGQSKIEASPVLSEQFKQAGALMTGLAKETLRPTDVFDVNQIGKYLALCELFHAEHSAAWNNIRFYYNPVIARIEPVGYDSNVLHKRNYPNKLTCVGGANEFFYHLLEDPAIADSFFAEVKTLRQQLLSPEFSSFVAETDQRYRQILSLDYPWLPAFSLAGLKKRLDFLNTLGNDNLFQHIDPPQKSFTYTSVAKDLNFPRLISFSLEKNEFDSVIEVYNLLSEDVSLLNLRFKDEQLEQIQALKELFNVELPLVLPQNAWQQPRKTLLLYSKKLNSKQQQLLSQNDIVLDAAVKHSSNVYQSKADYFFDTPEQHWLPLNTIESVLTKHAFLELDDKNDKLLRIKPGIWQVTEWLILPLGYDLELGPGTELGFAHDVGLISRGSIKLHGTKQKPIRLGPITATDSWPGLVSLESKTPHSWRHVVISNTSGMRYKKWSLTGGITLRMAVVDFEDVTIDGTLAEDALNLIRSQFNMRRLHVSNTRSDAYDGDFSNGTISDSLFTQVGGDAIDISGAKIEVFNTKIEQTRDKAISIGEASQLLAEGLEISHCGTAVASKDGSSGIIRDIVIDNIEYVALMAYNKKPEYGGAQLLAENITMTATALPALAQTGSLLEIDHQVIASQEIDIESLYSRGYMKK